MSDKEQERIPGINAPEGDPAYVDEESDKVVKDIDLAHEMALEEHPYRVQGAKFRKAANLLEKTPEQIKKLREDREALGTKPFIKLGKGREENKQARKEYDEKKNELLVRGWEQGSERYQALKGVVQLETLIGSDVIDTAYASLHSEQAREVHVSNVNSLRQRAAKEDQQANAAGNLAQDEFEHAKHVAKLIVDGEITKEGKNPAELPPH